MSGRKAHSSATFAGLLAAVALAGVSAALAAEPVQKSASLRGQANTLDARAHTAVLDLYALDSHLQAAQSMLASLESQAARLRAERVLLSQQLSATRRTLVTSQQRLASNLRSLYEQGDTDTLSVVLGAQSLDDAVTELDDLKRVADQSEQVVSVTNAASIRLLRVRSTLAARRSQLNRALASARRTTHALATARAQRLTFIAQLRNERQLKARQITALQLTAQHAEAKSQKLQAAADAATVSTPADPPSSAPSATPAVPAAPAPAGGRSMTVSSTGYSLPGHTATGIPVGWGVVAVDPSVIPLGTRLTIPGYGDAVAADTGSAVRGADIDLWFPTLAQARAWGRRTVTITIH